MKQFLIREFTDSAGYVHVNVEKPRENETFELVEVEDESEMKKYMSLIKRTLTILGILTIYELAKYSMTQLLIRLQANDDIDQPPKDFTDSNQDDLNELYKYIMNNETNHEVEDGLF